MKTTRWCDFEKLTQTVSGNFALGAMSDHGPTHWRRVERNGLWIATQTGADTLVTRLFAWFHDSMRENESYDPDHGRRGAEYARSQRGILFDLDEAAFETLMQACIWHTDGEFAEDITIGTCWDSDRLDLGRVGIIPSGSYMSREFGKEVASAGSFYPFLDRIGWSSDEYESTGG